MSDEGENQLGVRFFIATRENKHKSRAASQTVVDSVEMVEIRTPHDRKSVMTAPAHDRYMQGGPSYAERFPAQYAQFKAGLEQSGEGTPIKNAPFITDDRRRQLEARHVHTVEALAGLDGNALSGLGPGARELKNSATKWLEEETSRKSLAEKQDMQNQIDELKALLAKQSSQPPCDTFEAMSEDELREHLTAANGEPPDGRFGRDRLLEMARPSHDEAEAA